jgi:DNA modification methylase
MACIPGMKRLEDNSYDLGITDPPFNLKWRGSNFAGDLTKKGRVPIQTKKDFYDDNLKIATYHTWTMDWFKELQRVTKYQLILPGLNNLKWWVRSYDDFDILHCLNKCALPGSSVGLFAWITHWLAFGKFSQCYLANCIENIIEIDPSHLFIDITEDWARHRGQCKKAKYRLKHPTPKLYSLGEKLVTPLIQKKRIQSILDPFAGSGWIAEIGESLKLKYLGFEIKEKYAPDIQKRMKWGIDRAILLEKKKEQQKTLEAFF